MKKFVGCVLLLFVSCGVPKEEHQKLIAERDSIIVELSQSMQHIKELKDSIAVLSYPANQRYDTVLSLIKKDELDSALVEIHNLQTTFPKSKEAAFCKKQIELIEQKKEEKRNAELRRKALGFKALSSNSVVTLTDAEGKVRKCSFYDFEYGREFTYGYCEDVNEYTYETADKDHIYLLATMTMSTKEKFATSPNIGIFKIEGDLLKKVGLGRFQIEYSTWISYGAKIGNYADETHDFAKVNSITYNIAAEVSIKDSKAPLVILVNKDGSWTNNDLTIEDVHKNCIVVRVLNRNKIGL